jgi:Zn-dependent peptidase ImmA (M78 family)
LGHCILHTDQLIRLAQMPTNQQTAFHRGRTGHKPYEDTEWQANAFASALLMPARGIASLERERGYLDASLIVDRFGVSLEAAGYRLDSFTARRDELLR